MNLLQFIEWHRHPSLVRCPSCANVKLKHCFLCNDHTFVPRALALNYEKSIFKSGPEVARLRETYIVELKEHHKRKQFIRKLKAEKAREG